MTTESNRIEYKQNLNDSFEKEVVAFLNSNEGGIVYIGVDNEGKVIGCTNIDQIQLKIKDKLKHNISPSCLGLFEVILEKIEEKDVIKVVIASGRETPYYIKKYGMSTKGCFIRVGSSSEPMTQTMIEESFASRVRNSLSNLKSRRQDLTFEQLKIYYEEKSLKLNDRFTSNLELLTVDGYYNYVAYLMADSNGTSIKVAKYAGKNKVDLIENNEYGYCSLIKATKRVLEKLEIENKTAALITSTTRKEQPLWDKVALREAVINAIVHNDYTTENPPVFEIFSDRIEITSTGGLSVIKNLEDFFSGYYNPTSRELMRIYKDLELVEHLGSGLNRILEVYDRDSFVIKQNYMRNIFYKNENSLDEGVNGGVNGGVNDILEFIKNNPNLRAKQISDAITVPLRTCERYIKQLKKEDKIEFKGAPKTGGYIIKKIENISQQ